MEALTRPGRWLLKGSPLWFPEGGHVYFLVTLGLSIEGLTTLKLISHRTYTHTETETQRQTDRQSNLILKGHIFQDWWLYFTATGSLGMLV